MLTHFTEQSTFGENASPKDLSGLKTPKNQSGQLIQRREAGFTEFFYFVESLFLWLRYLRNGKVGTGTVFWTYSTMLA